MAIESAQINLADLQTGQADETQPRMASDRGADPKVTPELAALCAPSVADCIDAPGVSLGDYRDGVAGPLFEHVEAFVRASRTKGKPGL
jgi:hypothetical protein